MPAQAEGGESVPEALLEAVQGKQLAFCVAAAGTGRRSRVTAFVILALALPALVVLPVLLAVEGLAVFGLVWGFLVGGLLLMALRPRFRSRGVAWFAATSSHFIGARAGQVVHVPWTDLCEEVAFVPAQGGAVTLRLRRVGAAAQRLAQAGLLENRLAVAGREPSGSAGAGGRRPVHRAIEVRMAGLRDPGEVAAACARLLGMPVAGGPGITAAEGSSPVHARAPLRVGVRVRHAAGAALLALSAAFFLGMFVWSVAGLLRADASAEDLPERVAGVVAAPLFAVPLGYVAAVNAVEAVRPPARVQVGAGCVHIREGRRVRWVGWTRFAGGPEVFQDGTLRLRLRRADGHPWADHLEEESLLLSGGKDPFPLAALVQGHLDGAVGPATARR